jgi:hypothetical protein
MAVGGRQIPPRVSEREMGGSSKPAPPGGLQRVAVPVTNDDPGLTDQVDVVLRSPCVRCQDRWEIGCVPMPTMGLLRGLAPSEP